MINSLLAHRRRRAANDGGFTLIELLVVITILGILAAVVVFSVSGIGDKGESASKATEVSVLRTAEEAYCASNGKYATLADLKSGGYLKTDPGYSSVVKTNSGNCGGTGFVIGSSSFTQTTDAPRILAASNNTPGFTYLAQSFVEDNGPVQFLFRASSLLANLTKGTSSGDDAPSSRDALFASADEANANATIATTDPVAAGSAGTCSTNCQGIGSSKTLYAIGRLAIYSCKSGGKALTPAEPTHSGCAAPAEGYLASPPTTAAGAVALLNDPDSKFKLTIATPGTVPPAAGTIPTAPYGLAAYQALTSSAAGGGGLTPAQFKALVDSGRIIYGGNVGQTQTKVQTGAASAAMIPLSFEVSPGGNDTNNWTTISSTLHDPIKQWAVLLSGASATDRAQGKKFLDYVTSATGQSVLTSFGYQPLS